MAGITNEKGTSPCVQWKGAHMDARKQAQGVAAERQWSGVMALHALACLGHDRRMGHVFA